jgi:cytochrome c
MQYQVRLLVLLAGLSLASLSYGQAPACDSKLGAQVFAVCSACHALDSVAPQREGPHLKGLFKRRTAAQAGFPYSPAMKKADWVWSAAMLEKYLQAPKRVVPGTTMTFPGLKNPLERAALVCYLQSATE